MTRPRRRSLVLSSVLCLAALGGCRLLADGTPCVDDDNCRLGFACVDERCVETGEGDAVV